MQEHENGMAVSLLDGIRLVLPRVEAHRTYPGCSIHLISNLQVFTLHPQFNRQAVREVQTALAAAKAARLTSILDFGAISDMPVFVLEALDLVVRFARIGGGDVRCRTGSASFRTMLEHSRFKDLRRFVDDY